MRTAARGLLRLRTGLDSTCRLESSGVLSPRVLPCREQAVSNAHAKVALDFWQISVHTDLEARAAAAG